MKLLRRTLSAAAAADIVELAEWYEQQSGPALAKRGRKRSRLRYYGLQIVLGLVRSVTYATLNSLTSGEL
jgi:hypothetical protein